MQEETTYRLIDQAKEEPVKSAFRIGWEVVMINKPLVSMALMILIVLNMSNFIPMPFVGAVIAVLSAMFMVSTQIYIGRVFYTSQSMDEFASTIKDTEVMDLFKRYIATAMGSYVGWIVLFVVPLMFVILSFPQQGSSIDSIDINALFVSFIPLFVIMMIVLYIQPLLQANVILANGFSEGFKAVMTIFTKEIWSRAFTGRYFIYLTKFGLTIFAGMFLLGLIVGLITGLADTSKFDPTDMTTQMILGVLNTIFTFIFMIIGAIFVMLASSLAEPQEND